MSILAIYMFIVFNKMKKSPLYKKKTFVVINTASSYLSSLTLNLLELAPFQ